MKVERGFVPAGMNAVKILVALAGELLTETVHPISPFYISTQ